MGHIFCKVNVPPLLGDIACRNCYEKKYSCKAPYNELSGADMLKLLDTSIIQAAADDEKDRCPRCEFTLIRNIFSENVHYLRIYMVP